VFIRRIVHHFDETFNNLNSQVDKNIFLKPSMVSCLSILFTKKEKTILTIFRKMLNEELLL